MTTYEITICLQIGTIILIYFSNRISSSARFHRKIGSRNCAIFFTTTNAGKNKTEAKTFNKNVLKYFKSITPPNVSIALEVKMADVSKELYKQNTAAAYQFIMPGTIVRP